MWLLSLLTLRRSIGRSVLACSGFLLAACALILLSATTQTTAIRANQIIGQNWQPTYDLVVLPPQAKLPASTFIPADLLEGYGGGISMKQYEQIQKLPGVEVAAPIAFLGYVRLPVPGVQFTTSPLPPGYYRIDWTLRAFNGLHHIVERQERLFFYLAPSCATLSSAAFQTLQHQGILAQCGTGIPSFPSIDTGTFLMAAIDPTEENQLLHLNRSIVSGRMLTPQDRLQLDQHEPYIPLPPDKPNGPPIEVPAYDVPVVIHTQLPGQITLDATFRRVASASLSLQQVVAHGGISYLSRLPGLQTIFQGTVPMVQNDPQRFSEALLIWDGHTWKIQHYKQDESSLTFLYTPSALSYKNTTPPHAQHDPAFALIPKGVEGPEVAFRDQYPLHIGTSTQPPFVRSFYLLDPVGQFTGNTLAAQFSNPLNWLPENTYTPPPVVLRYNAQGQAVPSTTLIPTTNPAGYIMQPPLALTTLAAAQSILGNASISAIRVRVSDVTHANLTSWQRIQQVAQMIEQRTGLHVLVTLGSSPKPVLVYVPGLKQSTYTIAPLGWVEERWIFSGAAIVYLSQIEATRGLLLGAILLVCLGYLMVTFSTFATAQRRSFAVLSMLGWRPWQPAGLFLWQALVLACGGGMGGIGLALLVTTLLGAIPSWIVVWWTLPIVLGLATISVFYPLWQLWQSRPVEILHGGTSFSVGSYAEQGKQFWAFLPAIVSMALRNLARSKIWACIAVGSFFFSAAFLLIMLVGIFTFRQTLQGTLLGNFVLLQTTIPQIAGSVFAVLLTFLSVSDLLLLQVHERQQEIGLLWAVGWRFGLIRRLFMQEGVLLAISGAVPGVIVAMGILIIRHTAQTFVSPFLLIGSIVLLLVGVAALATLPALWVMNRLPIVAVLRSE
jgi:hypothetical protein